MGMRPVLTWKYTDAAPTPTSEGAASRPSAFSPWQDAQLVAKSFLPCSTSVSVCATTDASALVEAKAAYTAPVTSSASTSSTTGACRWCLRAAMAFTVGTSSQSLGVVVPTAGEQVIAAGR